MLVPRTSDALEVAGCIAPGGQVYVCECLQLECGDMQSPGSWPVSTHTTMGGPGQSLCRGHIQRYFNTFYKMLLLSMNWIQIHTSYDNAKLFYLCWYLDVGPTWFASVHWGPAWGPWSRSQFPPGQRGTSVSKHPGVTRVLISIREIKTIQK